MSDKIPGSSRLESLSRRTTTTTNSSSSASTAAKPGLKFKPKVVARRTKEERAADAPIILPTESTRPLRGNNNRGRGGGMRGGRGGRALAGTHVVQAGPLASGNVLNDTRQNLMSARSGYSSSSGGGNGGSDFFNKLARRDPSSSSSRVGSRGGSVGLISDEDGDNYDGDDDDRDDLARINMNEEYKFAESETELFPVRAPRSKLEHELKREVIDLSSASGATSATATREQTPDVKNEPVDDSLAAVLQDRDTQLQHKLNELQIKNEALTLGTEEATESTQRMNNDHSAIVETIQRINNKPDQFMLFQLPRVLPTFEQGENEVKDEQKGDDDGAIGLERLTGLEGEFGKLQIHKSGKITMKIGNVVMGVTKGAAADLLQEVVLMNKEGEHASSALIGHLNDKLVVTPSFS